MNEIDFLPPAYRRKCLNRQWTWKRLQIATVATCVLISFIVYDQQQIQLKRREIWPRLKNRSVALEDAKKMQLQTAEQIRNTALLRELRYSVLLRTSRSRVLNEIVNRLPAGTALSTLQMQTQPELWIANEVTSADDLQRAEKELKRIVEMSGASACRIAISGTARAMDDVRELEQSLASSGCFQEIKLSETRQLGNVVEFSLVIKVVNPFHTQELAQLDSPLIRNAAIDP